jgi:hypothetical protein
MLWGNLIIHPGNKTLTTLPFSSRLRDYGLRDISFLPFEKEWVAMNL